MRYRFGRSVLLVYLLATATSLHATSVARFTFDALCVQANTIAVVRCTESEAFREEATGRILTRTRLEVVRGVKGGPGSQIVLDLPGGRIGEARTVVPGIPQFHPGQEIVVFLTAAEEGGSAWPIGLDQGCYRLQADAGGGRSVLLQAGVTPLPGGALYKPASHKPFSVPLETFLKDVGRVLAPPSGQQ